LFQVDEDGEPFTAEYISTEEEDGTGFVVEYVRTAAPPKDAVAEALEEFPGETMQVRLSTWCWTGRQIQHIAEVYIGDALEKFTGATLEEAMSKVRAWKREGAHD
jgi:hypothetical protein